MSDRFVSACCGGERCAMCGNAAQAKVEEVIFSDDPTKNRHPFTAYVCGSHFDQIMHAAPSPQAQPVAYNWQESDARIKRLMAQCGMPESLSVYQAMKQLENEIRTALPPRASQVGEAR